MRVEHMTLEQAQHAVTVLTLELAASQERERRLREALISMPCQVDTQCDWCKGECIVIDDHGAPMECDRCDGLGFISRADAELECSCTRCAALTETEPKS